VSTDDKTNARDYQAMQPRDIPTVPALPKDWPTLPDANPDVAKCGECGMVWKAVMHYSCGNPRCPMQPHITC
jgi:hypothetical protein